MISSMKLHGLSELENSLKSITKEAGSRALVAALKDGAQPVEDDMKSNAPVLSGGLQSRIKKRSKKRKGAAIVTIGTAKQDFHAAIAAEFGTQKQSPSPFIRLSLHKNWRKSSSIVRYALKKRINQQARRLAKRKLKGI